jgi:hypothetical protein
MKLPWGDGIPSLHDGHRKPTTSFSLHWEYLKMRHSLYENGQRKHQKDKLKVILLVSGGTALAPPEPRLGRVVYKPKNGETGIPLLTRRTP